MGRAVVIAEKFRCGWFDALAPADLPRETAGRHSRAESLPAKAVSTPRRSYFTTTGPDSSRAGTTGREAHPKTVGASDLRTLMGHDKIRSGGKLAI